jgi:collagen beta-1,O-galactosyltransferase
METTFSISNLEVFVDLCLFMTSIYLSVENPPLPVSGLLAQFVSYPEQDTMGFDNIYMINLLRRPERRKRMLNCFKELGIHATILNAVDGL